MDSLYWGPIRVSQLLAFVSCAAAAVMLFWLARKPHDPEKLFVNQVAAREAAEEAAEIAVQEQKIEEEALEISEEE